MHPAVQPAAQPVESPRRDTGPSGLLRGLTLAALVVACAVYFAFNVVDPDLWGHVRYGQDWIADGQLHRTATHTYTAVGYPWINHENLAELGLAAGFDAFGLRGMLLAKCLLGLAILASMATLARRRGVGALTSWAFLLLLAACLQGFFPLRPQLLSFVCLTGVVLLLEAAFAAWRPTSPVAPTADAPAPWAPRVRWGWLALVPVALVAWVNSHGGFVAGVCIVCAYLGGRGVELLVGRAARGKTLLLALFATGLVCLATTLVNPYGLDLLGWLYHSLRAPRPEITEWAMPTPRDPVFWPFVTLVAVNLAAWGFTSRRRDWVHAALLAVVAWQSALHLRHIAFLALLSGFWTLPHVGDVVSQTRRRLGRGLPILPPGPAVQWACVMAVGAWLCVQSLGLTLRLTTLPVFRSAYPVDALEYMAERGVSGRMIVAFNWAQYALAALAPETTVGFDGRYDTCYPFSVVDAHFDFLLGENAGRRYRDPASGPVDGARVFSLGDPELALIDRNYKHAVANMADAAEGGRWVLLYQDGLAQLWGRADVFDNPASPRCVPPASRRVADQMPSGYTQWPALPGPPTRGALATRPRRTTPPTDHQLARATRHDATPRTGPRGNP